MSDDPRPSPTLLESRERPAEPPLPTDFKIYKPSVQVAAPLPSLPDEYFNPTAADLQKAQSQLVARTQALTNAPLQLRTAREAEVKAKRDRWPETKIRVKFADGTQLEKIFSSTGKIKPIYAFVRSCLREDVKPIKFVLYQPPKRELKVSDLAVRDLTLSELQLAPSSMLLVRFEDDSLNHPHIPAPLNPTILVAAIDLPQPPPMANTQPDSLDNKKAATSSASPSKTGDIKVPKWMKIGQKK
ncbi:hypothetical protein CPB83DRAFT_844428 [Crepidotus variabilis]|uniref:UBX domain-containing protein n=1 Tax=Crepidotus variabilis TaxID=179855 RepID=A0A9P6JVB8_9AGAR|nr:hypothetical protein CPB83DRAFT_844428 [Crepidotus variabilis]